MVKKLVGECDCGSVAHRRNANNEWVCDECAELQRRGKEIKGHYANHGRVKECTEETEETEEPPPSIAQHAINRLEQMLAGLDKQAG